MQWTFRKRKTRLAAGILKIQLPSGINKAMLHFSPYVKVTIWKYLDYSTRNSCTLTHTLIRPICYYKNTRDFGLIFFGHDSKQSTIFHVVVCQTHRWLMHPSFWLPISHLFLYVFFIKRRLMHIFFSFLTVHSMSKCILQVEHSEICFTLYINSEVGLQVRNM